MKLEEIQELKLLGLRLKKFRLEKKLSQEKLAELVELDRTYISGLERGKRNPSYLILKRLSLILEVTPNSFFQEDVV
ncbi:MAG: helix-turn-helix transcriptional regulator [Treponema sp.]|nr:helix-turn-helix transcriptional regulator [Treponema sp.]